MTSQYLGVAVLFAFAVLTAVPLGRYIARVFQGQRTWTDFLAPLENLLYRLSGIDVRQQMNWKQHMLALLSINLVWFVYAFGLLFTQGALPLNPDGNPSQSADLAWNTAISFLVNCNIQHYSGESGATYLTQMVVMMFLQFVSAATGIAALAVVFEALRQRTTEQLGNFWFFFVRSITRLLLPLCLVVASTLVFSGTPNTFQGKAQFVSVEGDTVNVSRGPVAAFVAIKELGTNGGGFMGVNGAHPLENPTYFTNFVETWAHLVIPFAVVFALGFYLQRKRLAWMVFGTMTAGFLMLLLPTLYYETHGSPALSHLGVDQALGALEGKEMRIGSVASAFWGITSTIISVGSVNSMHDSWMPVSGAMAQLGMMVNAFYGGCGVGVLNFLVYLIIAVFIAGLMVGRTPEFLGKKVEASEVKIAIIIALLHPFLILAGTALATYGYNHDPQGLSGWLANPGAHGFSEMLYEYTSASANNGSGFEGLGDNTPWWNVSIGFVLILARYLPIIGPVAIAGLLARKKLVPESAGTLRTDNVTFAVMILAVIWIIAALAFFPALTLGPLAEHFSL